MSDDAQTPAADAHGPTAPPGAERGNTAGAAAGAGQAPADRSAAVPGDGGKPWPPPVNGSPEGTGRPVPVPPDATPWPAPSVPGPDHQTVTSLPTLGDQPAEAAPTPPPQSWAAPSGPSAGPHGAAAATPPAPSNGAAPPNPFAAPTPTPPSTPAYGQGQNPAPVVPPPPIAPDGPGQVPYGYPGSYGYPGHGPGHGGGPQPQGAYGWPGMAPMPPSNGMGTTGLVLGVIAAVGFCMWPLAIVLGVLGVIFGVVGRAKARKGEATNAGQALAGIICGAFGIALGVGFAVLVFLSA